MEGVEVRKIQQFTDERGWLTEIMREDESDMRPAMTYISMTKPGMVRGPHEHRDQTDYFCFIGPFILYVWDNRKGSPTFMEHRSFNIGDEPTVAIIPPGIVHAYKNTGSGEGLVINLPDRLYRGQGKKEPVDEIRYEDDPQSPFQIGEQG